MSITILSRRLFCPRPRGIRSSGRIRRRGRRASSRARRSPRPRALRYSSMSFTNSVPAPRPCIDGRTQRSSMQYSAPQYQRFILPSETPASREPSYRPSESESGAFVSPSMYSRSAASSSHVSFHGACAKPPRIISMTADISPRTSSSFSSIIYRAFQSVFYCEPRAPRKARAAVSTTMPRRRR